MKQTEPQTAVPHEVKNSDYGCNNCLWAGAECKNGEKYQPKLTHDGCPSCVAYTYYD